MACILMQTLIGIDADFASIGQTKCPARYKPLPDQIARQSLTHFELEHLVKPGLRYIEYKQTARNPEENHQLVEESLQIPTGERIVERFVPSIDGDLSDGDQHDENENAGPQRNQCIAYRRDHKGPDHHRNLREEIGSVA